MTDNYDLTHERQLIAETAVKVAKVILESSLDLDGETRPVFYLAILTNLLANVIAQTWKSEHYKEIVIGISKKLIEAAIEIDKRQRAGDMTESWDIHTGKAFDGQ